VRKDFQVMTQRKEERPELLRTQNMYLNCLTTLACQGHYSISLKILDTYTQHYLVWLNFQDRNGGETIHVKKKFHTWRRYSYLALHAMYLKWFNAYFKTGIELIFLKCYFIILSLWSWSSTHIAYHSYILALQSSSFMTIQMCMSACLNLCMIHHEEQYN